jgi:FkbM family methyltransferase
VTADLASLGGLARSLVIYRARPWGIARLARFYRGLVGPGDLAFDIGAHVGNRTRALVRAGARVVALEPQRLFHGFLRRDLPASVTLLPLAAGRAEGRATLAVSRLHPTVSSIAEDFPARMRAAPGFGAVAWDAAETVAVTTLDRLVADHGLPRFVKIDVEGAEAEVLAGLSRPVAWIAFESLPASPQPTAASLDRLARLGRYRFNLVEGERRGFVLDRWLDRDGIGAVLAARPAKARPADVYARLDDA